MTTPDIESLTLTIADVTANTRWTFIEVRDASGRNGTWEASRLARSIVRVPATLSTTVSPAR